MVIKKFNCIACGMKIELNGEETVVCKNCNRVFDISEFNLNAKQDEPLVVFKFENNDK